jgi:hypothetical protein
LGFEWFFNKNVRVKKILPLVPLKREMCSESTHYIRYRNIDSIFTIRKGCVIRSLKNFRFTDKSNFEGIVHLPLLEGDKGGGLAKGLK